jgi:hypothetical protein
VAPQYHSEIYSLWEELSGCNLVVALGNPAIWALLGVKPTVGTMRGTFWRSPFIAAKIMPTWHPAFVLRTYKSRVIVVTDLMKAVRNAETREIHRPSRKICIAPTLDDLKEWEKDLMQAPLISIDLEDAAPSKKVRECYITCISFSPRPDLSYVVPFVKDKWASYWSSTEEEFQAWEFVRRICESKIPKLFQKHLFDTFVLRRGEYRIVVQGQIHDTMHLHHSLYPEMVKGLGFLGSIYTEEDAWKLERPKGKKGQEKREG